MRLVGSQRRGINGRFRNEKVNWHWLQETKEEENLLEGIEQDIENQISELIRFPGGESGHLCSGWAHSVLFINWIYWLLFLSYLAYNYLPLSSMCSLFLILSVISCLYLSFSPLLRKAQRVVNSEGFDTFLYLPLKSLPKVTRSWGDKLNSVINVCILL